MGGPHTLVYRWQLRHNFWRDPPNWNQCTLARIHRHARHWLMVPCSCCLRAQLWVVCAMMAYTSEHRHLNVGNMGRSLGQHNVTGQLHTICISSSLVAAHCQSLPQSPTAMTLPLYHGVCTVPPTALISWGTFGASPDGTIDPS